jgi:oligoendopeptidase F
MTWIRLGLIGGVQRNFRRVLRRGENERAFDLSDPFDLADPITNQQFISLDIRHKNLQEEVEFSGDVIALHHFIDLRDGLSKSLDRLILMKRQTDHRPHDDLHAEPVGIQQRGVMLDESGLFQIADTLQRRWGREVDALGELSVRDSPICLKQLENFEVDLIQILLHAEILPVGDLLALSIWAFPRSGGVHFHDRLSTMSTVLAPSWDLTPYFPNLESPEFSTAVQKFRSDLSSLESLFDEKGIQLLDAAVLDDALVSTFEKVVGRVNSLLEDADLLESYVNCYVDTDSRNERALSVQSELDLEFVRLSKLYTRLVAWVGSLPVEDLKGRSQVARDHAFALHKAQIQARHQMSPAEEALAADLSTTGSTAWAKLHGNLTSQIEVVLEVNGEVRSMPMSAVRTLAYDPDPQVRKAAYEAELAAWKQHEMVLAACMNGIKGEVGTLSNRRGWSSPLERAIETANIDKQTLDAMMSAAKEFFPTFRRYLRAKARMLGSGDRLPWWDIFAPLGGSEEGWDYSRATKFVVDNFRSYSDKMADFADLSFKDNWIDVAPKPGKRDGAYCTGMRAGESRILMNFKPSFGSVSTLAHELGHAYHNLCLKDRLPLQKGTPMTLAETASIFCETIIRQAGIQQGSESERLNILEAALQGYTQVVVDITSRFLFEQSVFEKRKGRELSASELCEFMVDAQRQTYGDGLTDDLHPYMWAVKPHYYSSYSFYNYPYMFGLLFGLGLYAQYQQDPQTFKAGYDDLLSSTGLADAATLAQRFGIDVRSIDFWRGSLSIIAGEIEAFEKLA